MTHVHEGDVHRDPIKQTEPPLADDDSFEGRLHEKTAWQGKILRTLLVVDLAAVGVAVLAAYYGRFVLSDGVTGSTNYPLLALILILAWMALLWAFRCYEPRLLGVGTEEFRRVVTTSFALFGTIAILSFSFKLQVARGFVAVALPLGVTLLVLERFSVRQWIQRRRRQGRLLHRVLVVGDCDTASVLASTLARDPHSGFSMMGMVVPSDELTSTGNGSILGSIDSTLEVIRSHALDTVALSASAQITPPFVRQLAWSLEGSGVDLVVAPALTDVAGPRIAIRPVAGLPLMYVDEPTFSGWTRFIKRSIDLIGSGVGLLLLGPILILIAISVRTTSKGPAIFKQARIGANGQTFVIWKFRTMKLGADEMLQELLVHHGREDGPLFKVPQDPRVTSIGKYLRRYSLDELPQLVNVFTGSMSLVGPRPQRPAEVEFYDEIATRRLLIRPGVTGLWQVSGRSDVSWEEAVRLDLYYVENWSLAMDTTILLRTVLAVLRGEGAY